MQILRIKQASTANEQVVIYRNVIVKVSLTSIKILKAKHTHTKICNGLSGEKIRVMHYSPFRKLIIHSDLNNTAFLKKWLY